MFQNVLVFTIERITYSKTQITFSRQALDNILDGNNYRKLSQLSLQKFLVKLRQLLVTQVRSGRKPNSNPIKNRKTINIPTYILGKANIFSAQSNLNKISANSTNLLKFFLKKISLSSKKLINSTLIISSKKLVKTSRSKASFYYIYRRKKL